MKCLSDLTHLTLTIMSVNDIRREPTTELFEVKLGELPSSATFIFGNEVILKISIVCTCILFLFAMFPKDHTLGNALRHVLMQKEETDFCGYSVPHPYEPKMNLRLQTKGPSSISVLQSGLKDLELATDQLNDVFQSALANFSK